ncbi:sensor histidine kinase [Brevibacterium casei]|uniref:ATP-binding protein n=1 Tax=Brevibacterium casei TaxID=33889 RepID=UPI00223BEEDF|nr:sensor histidine kinase [Brevibacterium casei]MCT2359069.1 sensor histidine kinase [Brevibacterium casei]
MATSRTSGRRSVPLARRLFVLQLVLIVAVCAVLSVTSYLTARDSARDATADRVLSIAETLANDPFVAEAVTGPDPSARLQPYAQTVVDTADVDFVTIMDRDRTRYTHPDPDEIGRPYIGSIGTALTGQSEVEEYAGTLGPSVRAIAPIMDASGEVTAMVAVGVTLETISLTHAAALPQILIVAAVAIALGGLGAWILSRYLKRVTLGYGPEQLKRLFAFYDSALHSLREGLILVDDRARLVLYNDEAAALLDLPRPADGEPVPLTEVALPASIRALLTSGRVAVDETHLTADRVLVISQKAAAGPEARAAGQEGAEASGTVVTLRDRTDFEELSGELATMRTLSEALRAQTHEHANRLHTVSNLIELGRIDDALEFAVRDEQESQRLTDTFVDSLDEPFITALMIGKAAQAHERGIELTVTATGELPPGSLDARDLVTVAGNLIDNALDAAADSAERHVWADFVAADGELIITIADSGAGIDETEIDAMLRLGATGKAEAAHPGGRGFGLALVRQAVARLGGQLAVESDGGAIVTVTLPVTPADDPAAGNDRLGGGEETTTETETVTGKGRERTDGR